MADRADSKKTGAPVNAVLLCGNKKGGIAAALCVLNTQDR
jgi:hypothetical protein